MKLKPLTNKSGNARTPTATEARRFRPAGEVDPALVTAYQAGKIKNLKDGVEYDHL